MNELYLCPLCQKQYNEEYWFKHMFNKHTERERDLIMRINEKRQQIQDDEGDEALREWDFKFLRFLMRIGWFDDEKKNKVSR